MRQELEPIILGEDRRRISVEGPAISLAPKAALAFGMAFHELAANAAKQSRTR